MAHQVQLDALQSHKLSAFYMALVLLYSDLSLKEIDEIIRQEGFEEIERILFENIAHKPEKQNLLSLEQIEKIMQLLKSIWEGDEDEILQLATVIEKNEKMSHFLDKARRYLLKKNRVRTRSKEEWIDRSESLLESLSSSTTSLLTHIRDIAEQEDTKVLCYVYAEMDKELVLDRDTLLTVVLSRELLERDQDRISQSDSAEVVIHQPLIIKVIPKGNFDIVGERYKEVQPPMSGKSQNAHFILKPTHLGMGEIWVEIYQSQIPLVGLELKPMIVQKRSDQITTPKTSGYVAIADAEQSSRIPHLLYIDEIRIGGEVVYEYWLDSHPLDIMRKDFRSDPIQGNRSEYVSQLYKNIEECCLRNRDDYEAFAEELQVFGGDLYDQLFPRGLQEVLWENRDNIESIMVYSEEPFIPWELVHLKPPDQAGMPDRPIFFSQMGLVRWLKLNDRRWPREQITIRQHKTRYLIPEYSLEDNELPQLNQECQFLEEKFSATAIEPDRRTLRKALSTSGEFDLFHFAGHCAAEINKTSIGAKLLLGSKNHDGESPLQNEFTSLTAKQISRFDKKNPPLIVLNACQAGRSETSLTSIGGFAKAFLEGGAGAFVGPLWSVDDRASRVFIETFYKKLLEGLSLAEATKSARKQAKKLGGATWLAYAVYGHPNLKVTRST